ncbi:hypothetical protein [Klebsiella pneumoniae]|uniref:hypothetical protein n=1 Tax=Klebsiella pneumoniae TaxID=573 RepID=UPI003B5B0CB3
MFFCACTCVHPNYGGSGGADYGRAGSSFTGILTPVWATTPLERENSGGSTTH